jgi:hypothetical protein
VRSRGALCLVVSLIANAFWCGCLGEAVAQSLKDATEIDVPKFALVVGNRDYSPFPPVPTAQNDAALVAKQLSSLNFDVVVRVNVTYLDLIKEIGELQKRVQRVSSTTRPVVALYFSGHGFVASGRQFIAGVNASNALHVDPTSRSASIQYVVDQLSQTAFLVSYVDACRSDLNISDSSGKFASSVVESGDGNKGLGSLRDTSGLRPQQYLIAYANRLGDPVAGYIHKGDLNSPYTNVLIRHLGNGHDVMFQLGRVREEVQRTIVNHDPNVDWHMNGNVYLSFDQRTLTEMRREWAEVADAPSESGVRDFLANYENGPLAYKASEWLQSGSN